MSEIEIYSAGLIFVSVCASSKVDIEGIVGYVNDQHPTGLEHGWKKHSESFKDGTPNPVKCNHNDERKHWLLSC